MFQYEWVLFIALPFGLMLCAWCFVFCLSLSVPPHALLGVGGFGFRLPYMAVAHLILVLLSRISPAYQNHHYSITLF